MPKTTSVPPKVRKYLDLLERVFWTLVQAGSATAIVEWFDWDRKWIAPIALVLAAVKGAAGLVVGNGGTASTLPAKVDPATPPVAPA